MSGPRSPLRALLLGSALAGAIALAAGCQMPPPAAGPGYYAPPEAYYQAPRERRRPVAARRAPSQSAILEEPAAPPRAAMRRAPAGGPLTGRGSGGDSGGGAGGGSSGGGSSGGGSSGGGSSGGGSGGSSGGGWSDRRLKTDVRRIGTSPRGLPIYAFRYVWGGPTYVGVMAQDLLVLAPEAVIVTDSGYMMVDYDLIDVAMTTLEDSVARVAA